MEALERKEKTLTDAFELVNYTLMTAVYFDTSPNKASRNLVVIPEALESRILLLFQE